MKKLFSLAAMGLSLIACTTTHPMPSFAAEPTVLVMGEDWDEDTIPRNSRVFERVLDAVTNQLQQESFKVINETMATQGAFVQGRVRRTDVELLKLAKSIDSPPIDAAVTFKVYPRFKPTSTTTWMNALVPGRLLNVSSNESLGTFEVTLPQDVATEPGCQKNRECMLEYMGKHARNLGQELGAALSIKLRRAVLAGTTGSASAATGTQTQSAMAQAFKLTFDNFKPNEFDQVEEYMVAFSGYNHHKVLQSGSRNMVIWYETTSEGSRLKRNLRKMFEFMGLEGQVNCVSRTCTVTKI